MSNITNPEDLKLPAASVAKVLKHVADEKTTFSSEFETAVARASAVFLVNSVDSSLDHANKAGRSTMKAEDIISAMGTLGHPQLQDELQKTLNVYRAHKLCLKRKVKK